MIPESEIIPYNLSNPLGERIIVIAPHPDDETLGCGGAISLLVEAQKKIKIIFLTSGDKGDPNHHASRIVHGKNNPSAPSFRKEDHITEYSIMREREAERALRVLGVSDYEFLRFPDRGLHDEYRDALERILRIVEEFAPDTVYTPSMVEPNPDHRAAAALAMEIQKIRMQGCADSENPGPVRIVFYEVVTPIRPNILVDITSVYSRKRKAVKRYKSQLEITDYLRHVTALNTIRALTVRVPRYVEAFWFIERPLSDEDVRKWLSYGEILSEIH